MISDHYVLLAHILIAVIPAIIWNLRSIAPNVASRIADVLGVISLPAVAYTVWSLFDDRWADIGVTAEEWFIVMSQATFGAIPMLSALAFWLFGRIVGRVLKTIRA